VLVLGEEKQIPRGNDRKNGKGKSRSQYRGPSPSASSGSE
jgi:hypothetical protein